ncbi:MAG: hypothetical protein ACKVS7_09585 [Gemmatimonadaceae bacterium]
MTIRLVLALFAVLVAWLALNARPTRAQPDARSSTSGTRRSLQVALVEMLSAPNARAELVRFADPGRADLILLREGVATSADLAAALSAREAAEPRRPSRPGSVARTTIVGVGPQGPGLRDRMTRAEQMLREVRRSPVVRIGNVGQGRWSEFRDTC